MFAEDDCLPISALQHLLFCPRQCALIHVEQLWAENRLTLEGRHLHQKADRGRAQRRAAVLTGRSIMLRSLTLGLFGKADVVELNDSAANPGVAPAAKSFFPVEYKRGKPKRDGSDTVQLCAQALCLEEMLEVIVPAGAIFYGRTRRRHDVVFDPALRALTLKTIGQLHEMIRSGITPPARREKKCRSCSLLHLCIPDALQGCESASRYFHRSLQFVLNADGPVTSIEDAVQHGVIE